MCQRRREFGEWYDDGSGGCGYAPKTDATPIAASQATMHLKRTAQRRKRDANGAMGQQERIDKQEEKGLRKVSPGKNFAAGRRSGETSRVRPNTACTVALAAWDGWPAKP